ncbi:MAG TPA: diguanylate cyclase [Steroidobacteraceae bacterium]|jgi:diguanylate cyclase (GGDEF)-like protein|nr:diguanylate cyclase [Steroidobacteraceae bacterium]
MSTVSNDNAPQLDSTAARQFRKGFRWLRFEDPVLEQDFRNDLRLSLRNNVAVHLWLAIALLSGFILVNHYVLKRAQNSSLMVLMGIALSILIVCAVVVMSERYQKYYHRYVQWLAPLFGLCAVLNSFVDQPSIESLTPTIVLVLTSIYLMAGMLFIPALLSGLFVMLSYYVAGSLANMPTPELFYNVTVLFSANAIGATACYTLERLHRVNFLETRLLAEMANRDGLTGIHNRRAYDEHLQRVWQLAVREEVPVALLLIDIDYFKLYNDHYGHQAGDDCLKRVAALLSSVARRPLDLSARYGGEEFAMILYDARRDYVEDLTTQIRNELRKLEVEHLASKVGRNVTVSIGAACVLPQLSRSTAGWVQLADEALYTAKGSGRDRCVIMDKEYATIATGRYKRGKAVSVAKTG